MSQLKVFIVDDSAVIGPSLTEILKRGIYYVYALVFKAMLLLTAIDACSQSTINTGRPSVSENAGIVSAGSLQFENGLAFISRKNLKSLMIPDVLARTGITNRLEARIGATYYGEKDMLNDSPYQHTFKDVTTGIKYNFTKVNGWIPEFSAIVKYGMMTENKDFLLTFDHVLGKRFSVTNNVVASWVNNSLASYAYIFFLNYKVNNKTTVFIENFNYYYSNATNEHAFHAGVVYLLAPLVQLDCTAATYPFSRDSYFIQTGLSFRIDFKKPLTVSPN